MLGSQNRYVLRSGCLMEVALVVNVVRAECLFLHSQRIQQSDGDVRAQMITTKNIQHEL